ncbi:VOC family protein [Leptospira wolffii]|uniref:VOC family protein n=1 Tax=Leptospira wolffii TaxID=409998 RepID=UPI0002E909A6|nr:VOC family protein [Leptospira wolffii]EPG64811.1 glyoxalase-like domain protein [Leptospira wolffii serovar Khorat str. Khorat-H2]
MFLEVNHIGITSRDPEVSANFYKDIFELSGSEEGERALKILGIGNSNIAIYGEKKDSKISSFSSGCDFAFRVDTDRFYSVEKKLLEQKMEYEARKEGKILYLIFEDPDGYLIELICEDR